MRPFWSRSNWILAGGVASFVVATFLVFEFFGFDQTFWVFPTVHGSGTWAVLGILILIADVVLPIPSSLIMLSNGAAFGVAAGAALSMIGRSGAFAIGYLLGALGLRHFRQKRHDSDARLLSDRAWIGIVLTRSIPVLSETVAIMTGASKLPFGRSLLAALVGSIPESIVLAAAGDSVVRGKSARLIVFSLSVIVCLYCIAVRVARRVQLKRTGEASIG